MKMGHASSALFLAVFAVLLLALLPAKMHQAPVISSVPAVSVSKLPVPEKMLSSIAITAPPNKTQYKIGDDLNIGGLRVTGSYSDGSTEVLPTTTLSVTGFDSSIANASEVLTVSSGTKAATYTITVEEYKDEEIGKFIVDKAGNVRLIQTTPNRWLFTPTSPRLKYDEIKRRTKPVVTLSLYGRLLNQ